MNLPRPLFWRVRRKVWRSLIMNAAGLSTLSWTRLGSDDRQPPEPPPPPKRPMKALFFATLAVILGLFVLGLSSCATTRTTLPDGTVIESTTPAIKDDTKRFAADVIRAWSPRPIQPRREK